MPFDSRDLDDLRLMSMAAASRDRRAAGRTPRSKVFGALLLVAATARCGDGPCNQSPPSFKLEIAVGEPSIAEMIRTLVVTVETGGNRYRQDYDIGGKLEDGKTSLVVVVDPPPSAAFDLTVTAEGRNESTLVARGSGRFSGTPDACNRFSISMASTTSSCQASGLVCPSGCSCELDCRRSQNCNAQCSGAGASCTILCGSSTRRCDRSACIDGASCLIECGGAASCNFERCDGGAMTCPGDVRACNRGCP